MTIDDRMSDEDRATYEALYGAQPEWHPETPTEPQETPEPPPAAEQQPTDPDDPDAIYAALFGTA